MLKLKTSLCFEDVLLTPKYSNITSRSEIDTSINLGKNINLDIPFISAPMDTVTGPRMASAMARAGGLGIIHRYNTTEEQVNLVNLAVKRLNLSEGHTVGAAIGVTGDYIERAKSLVAAGAQVLCVDVAHGHHANMRHALLTLRNTLGYEIHIMAGNVATLQGFNDLADWGADSIRIGIGGGSICSTRIQTGHGVPTFQSILDCAASDRDAALIADGGIKNSGDIVKAIAAGAHAVIMGSLFSGTTETPGDIIYKDIPGKNPVKHKVYRGMASTEAQKDWRGKASSVEGISSYVKYKGPIKNIIQELDRGLRSGMSYSGVRCISEFWSRASFIQQTSLGTSESSTHIDKISFKT